MFDQIISLVKEHMGNNPQVANAIPAEKADAIHHEIATHINDGVKNQASSSGGIGGLLSGLSGNLTSGSPSTSGIEGGVVGTLGSKFGLSPAVTGAIAGALPGILQKLAHKANDPDDNSITSDKIKGSLPSGLGNLF